MSRAFVEGLADEEERGLHAVAVEDVADGQRGRIVGAVVERDRHLVAVARPVGDRRAEPRRTAGRWRRSTPPAPIAPPARDGHDPPASGSAARRRGGQRRERGDDDGAHRHAERPGRARRRARTTMHGGDPGDGAGEHGAAAGATAAARRGRRRRPASTAITTTMKPGAETSKRTARGQGDRGRDERPAARRRPAAPMATAVATSVATIARTSGPPREVVDRAYRHRERRRAVTCRHADQAHTPPGHCAPFDGGSGSRAYSAPRR